MPVSVLTTGGKPTTKTSNIPGTMQTAAGTNQVGPGNAPVANANNPDVATSTGRSPAEKSARIAPNAQSIRDSSGMTRMTGGGAGSIFNQNRGGVGQQSFAMQNLANMMAARNQGQQQLRRRGRRPGEFSL